MGRANTFLDNNKKKRKDSHSKHLPFITIANLVTNLLEELMGIYVTNDSHQDKKMRRRVNHTIELINNRIELSNMMISNDPFKKHGTRGQASNSNKSPEATAAADKNTDSE